MLIAVIVIIIKNKVVNVSRKKLKKILQVVNAFNTATAHPHLNLNSNRGYKLLLLYRLHHHIAKHVENYFWVANNSDFKLDKTEEHIREYFDIPELTKDKENYAKLSTEPKYRYRHLTGDTHSVTSSYTSCLFIKNSFVVFRL